ncbi:MAG: 50S ribosomal protein L19 [Candidatus Kerfeldbacteria bacterium]|nr:50S ribosomal protein L19 [Candidatus Kerfeldbacteria bacterium]
MKKTIAELNKQHLKTDLPDLKPGQTVAVYQKIIEGEKERIQKFEGTILGRSGGNGINGTITVRKIAEGVGVEKIFPINLPTITKIEVLKTARVRRAKLYYLRSYKKKLKEIKGKK